MILTDPKGPIDTDVSRLARIVDEVAQRLDAEQTVDVEEFARQYPEHAEELRQLIPSLQSLIALGHTSVGDDPWLSSNDWGAERRRLGDFHLRRELGRGGMGIVYEAEQISLDRRVAVKVLPFAAVLDPQQLQRFRNEAQAAAALQHPRIVSVFSVGYERAVHFYAMELIEGQNLAEVIAELRQAEADQTASVNDAAVSYPAAETGMAASLSTQRSRQQSEFVRSVARLGIQAAEALDYAHRCGVVHRDIKPSNLLVDHSGKLWITDFGLAFTQNDGNLTLTGDLLGTLRYMSPEQAEGDRRRLDHRTDIYSLGATLFELLALRPLFADENRASLLHRILHEDPPQLTKPGQHVPRDLETVVLKTLAKEPADRYATAEELAVDLRRFLDGEPVQARRSTHSERLWRWCDRNRALAVSISTVAVLLLVLGVGGPLMAIRQTALAAREAESRRLYEENLVTVQDALDKALTQLAEAVRNKPGMLVLQREVLQTALASYDKLLQQAGNDRALRFRTALAYRQAGRVDSRGETIPEKEDALERAIEILSALAAEEPANDAHRRELAEAHKFFGYYRLGELRELDAIDEFRVTIDLWRVLADQHPEDHDYPRKIAYHEGWLGHALARLGKFREAEPQILAGQRAWQKLDRTSMSEEDYLVDVGSFHFWLGHVQMATYRYDEAERSFRAMLEIEDAVAGSPTLSRQTVTAFARTQICFAELLLRLRRPEEAESLLRRTMVSLESLERDFPEAPDVGSHFQGAFGVLGRCVLARGQTAAAEQALRERVLRCQTTREKVPQRVKHQSRLGWAHFQLGQLLAWTARSAEAASEFEQARQHLSEAFRRDPSHRSTRILWARFLATCRDLQFRDAAQAVELIQSSLEPQDGREWQLLAVAQCRAGNFSAAVQTWQQALPVRNGGDAFDWLYLAMAHGHLGHRAEALRYYTNAVRAIETQQPIELANFRCPTELELLRREAEAILQVESPAQAEPDPGAEFVRPDLPET